MTQNSQISGHDRSYKRGAVMGLTVAEAFILLAFCLLLLFAWWQTEAEEESRRLAELFGDMTKQEQSLVLEGLTDGSFEVARQLREAGFTTEDMQALRDAAKAAPLLRARQSRRLLQAARRLWPATRQRLALFIEAQGEEGVQALLKADPLEDGKLRQISARLEESARRQSDLARLLDARLGALIREAGGEMDEHGTIALPHAALFDLGQDRIKSPELLLSICAPWLEVLQSSGLNVSELKIEGHASSEARPLDTPDQAYLYNLDLSQRRSQNALRLCLQGVREPAAQDWARRHLAAIGYSSTRLIRRPDGSEDYEASRRVMFSVSLDQSLLLEEIKREIRAGSPR